MSGRFVRASKYRHVFGRPTKKEQCYDNLRISKNAWDTNLIKANPSYISVNWEASGGGAFAVIPVNERGKLPEQIPLFRGHTAAVLDTDWSPFDDSFLASGSDDGKVLLWKVPANFSLYQELEDIRDVAPLNRLTGHSRKVGHVLFNPSAESVLASSSGDYTVKLWNVEDGSSSLTLKHNDIVQSLSWSANGSLLVTTCRDKKLRIWDPRQERPALETLGHSGAKNSRAVWMGEKDRIATTGFSKMSDRQLGLWDARAGKEPIDGFQILDQISGVCMPFWDDGCNCLYLAGKGDGNIRYYEYENDRFEYLSQHSSPDPQRGMAFLPKRGVNTHENEIMRAYRTVNDTLIEPVSFIVPRRAEVFQEDIYPPTVGTKPGLSATDWLRGEEKLPPRISLESVYDGKPPVEISGDHQQPPSAKHNVEKATTGSKTSANSISKVEQLPESLPRNSIPSMKDNQASISDTASKFADKDGNDESIDHDATDDFEHPPKPIQRPNASSAESNGANLHPKPEAFSSIAKGAREPVDTPDGKAETAISVQATPNSLMSKAAEISTISAGDSELGILRSQLQNMRNLLEQQQKTITAHGDQIETLTHQIELLKGN